LQSHDKNILVLYKDLGKFYKAYENDAIILNYLIDYKIIKNRVGFPDTALEKVIKVLENEHISYQVLSYSKNPIYKDYRRNNRYLEIYNKAILNYEVDSKIDMIFNKIQNMNVDDKSIIISKLEGIIN